MGKSFARSLDDCRFTFFSSDLPKGDLIRYQWELAQCSPVRLLDLSALNKVGRAGWQAGGRAGGCGHGSVAPSALCLGVWQGCRTAELELHCCCRGELMSA